MLHERFNVAFKYLIFTGLIKNQKDLANKMGTYPACVSNAIKGDEKYLTTRFVKRFNECFGNIFNEEWLFVGRGEMLSNPNKQGYITIGSCNSYGDSSTGNNTVTIGSHSEAQQGTNTEIQLRPIVTKALACKPNTDVYIVMKSEGAKMQHLVAFRQYEDFDFYYQVRQDAMLPVYGQGDVLALTHLDPDADIIQGAAMVVDTKDFGFVLRNVYDRGDYYECRCVNKDSKFESQNISKEKVIRLYRIVYSVRTGD